NEEMMQKYEMQLSTGKKIQTPSDDPIVAVRALKFRTNVREISQYKTNSEDANSWLSVNEQAMNNSLDLLQRARELSVQGSSDIYSTEDRANITAELTQIKTQIFNEANVNYAGRFVFAGFKTDQPVVFTKDMPDTYEITEHIGASDISTVQKVIGENVIDVPRYRLGYSGVSESAAPLVPSNIPAPYTLVTTDSSGTGLLPGDSAYQPPADTIYFLEDTGEMIFNQDNVDGTVPAAAFPANIDFTYEKGGLSKGDLNPQMYFESINQTTGNAYIPPNDKMVYQISYNQEIDVNTNAKDIFTVDMYRDFEEVLNSIENIPTDGSIQQSLEEDILGDVFENMMTKLDDHLNTVVIKEAEVGSRVNRLNLTIARLEDDKINFTDLLSINEDADMTEATLNLRAQEIVYTASLQSSTQIMQQSLLDFLR
nr:flagellar hook-associated protein FlgL [Vallitaleaceae bacterium]